MFVIFLSICFKRLDLPESRQKIKQKVRKDPVSLSFCFENLFLSVAFRGRPQ